MEQNIRAYYDLNYAGQVQVIGPDLYNCTAAGLTGFKNQTGATYPLLLNGATSTGGNIGDLYANGVVAWDNYVVINKQGIIRYHAALTWPHGDRFHLDEIRGSIDTLVSQVAGVDGPASSELALSVAPNPFAGRLRVSLSIPAAGVPRARVSVLDVRGRRLATLWDGPAGGGILPLEWNAGAAVRPGVYFVQAEVGSRRLQRRVVVIR